MVTTRRQLLETIEMRSATVASMKLLRENISRETNHEIGYNTLRRFFGLLPAREPSARTWSILDAYLKMKREGSGAEDFMGVGPCARIESLVGGERSIGVD